MMVTKEKYTVCIRVLELRNAGAELQPLRIQFVRNNHVASSRPNKSRRAIKDTDMFTAVWHDSDDMSFDLNLQNGSSSRMALLKSFSSDGSFQQASVTFGDGNHDRKKIKVNVLNSADQSVGNGHFFVSGAVHQRVALKLKKKGKMKAANSVFFTLVFELKISLSRNTEQVQNEANQADPSSFLAVFDHGANAVEMISSSSSFAASSCVMSNARGNAGVTCCSSTPSAVLTDTSNEFSRPPTTTSRESSDVRQRPKIASIHEVLLSSTSCVNDTDLRNDAKYELPPMIITNENNSVAESSVLTSEFQVIHPADKNVLNRALKQNTDPRLLRSIDEVESVEMCNSIGEETINSIRQAKATLHRHAKRHGLKIQITGSINKANDELHVMSDSPEVASFIHMLCCNPSQEPTERSRNSAPLFQKQTVHDHRRNSRKEVKNRSIAEESSQSNASSSSETQSYNVVDDFTVGSSTINSALG